jgi:hypothetical protein
MELFAESGLFSLEPQLAAKKLPMTNDFGVQKQASQPRVSAPPKAPRLGPAPMPFDMDDLPLFELPPTRGEELAFKPKEEAVASPLKAPRLGPAPAPFDLKDIPALELPEAELTEAECPPAPCLRPSADPVDIDQMSDFELPQAADNWFPTETEEVDTAPNSVLDDFELDGFELDGFDPDAETDAADGFPSERSDDFWDSERTKASEDSDGDSKIGAYHRDRSFSGCSAHSVSILACFARQVSGCSTRASTPGLEKSSWPAKKLSRAGSPAFLYDMPALVL